jgi:hypothetical protein
MGTSPLSQIERRRIEAELLAHVYATLLRVHDQATALALVAESVEAAAAAAGRAFAGTAAAPGLAHFATVLDAWQASGALDLRNLSLSGDTLSFEVVRCDYATMYRDMGLPPELAAVLSCCRDAPFARGYSPCLSLDRPATIAEGAPSCRFRFTWREDAG